MSLPIGPNSCTSDVFSAFKKECLIGEAFSDKGFSDEPANNEQSFKKFEPFINTQNGLNETFLRLVVETDRVAFAAFLLKKNADVFLADVSGNSPFQRVCQLKKRAHFYVFMSHFFNSGDESQIKRVVNEPNVMGEKPLVLAFEDATLTQVLMAAGANPLQIDGEKNNLLHYAARQRSFTQLAAFLATCSIEEMQSLLDRPNAGGKTAREMIAANFPHNYQKLNLPEPKRAEDLSLSFSRRASRQKTPFRKPFSRVDSASSSSSSSSLVDDAGLDRDENFSGVDSPLSEDKNSVQDRNEHNESPELDRTRISHSVEKDANKATVLRLRLLLALRQGDPQLRSLKEQYVLETLTGETVDMRSQLSQALEKADQLKAQLADRENVLATERSKIEDLQQAVDASEKALLGLSTQIEELNEEREMMRGRVAKAEQTTAEVSEQLNKNQRKREELGDKIVTLREKLVKKTGLIRALDVEATRVLATLDANDATIKSLQQEIDGLKRASAGQNRIIGSTNENVQQLTELERKEADLSARADHASQLKAQLEQHRKEVAALAPSLEQHRTELEESERSLESAQAEMAKLSADLEECKKSAEAAKAQSKQLESDLQIKDAELTASKQRETKLKEELGASRELIRKETEELRSRLTEQEAALQQERRLIGELQAQVDSRTRELGNMRTEIDSLTAERNEKQKEAQTARDLSTSLQTQLVAQEVERASLLRSISEQQNELEASRGTAQTAQQESDGVQARLRENESTVDTLRQEIAGLRTQLETVQTAPLQTSQLQSRLAEKEALLSTTSTAIESLRQNLSASERSAKEAQAKLATLQTDLDKNEKKLARTQRGTEELKQALETSQNTAHDAEQRSTELLNMLGSKESELVASKAQEVSLRAQLEKSQAHLTTGTARIQELGRELDDRDVTIAEQKSEISELQAKIKATHSTHSGEQSTSLCGQVAERRSSLSLSTAHSQLVQQARNVQTVSNQVLFPQVTQVRMMTKLKNACIQGDDKTVRIYLEDLDGDPQWCDENGMTFLHHAAAHRKSAVASVLLEYGAFANVQDTRGKFPADLVQGETDEDKRLRKMLANPMIHSGLYLALNNKSEEKVVKYAATLEYMDLSYREPKTGNTWLHLVVQFVTQRSSELAIMILERDANLVNVKNRALDTSLHILCDTDESPLNTTLVGILTSYGADSKAENPNRQEFLRSPYTMVQGASPDQIRKRASKHKSSKSASERMLNMPQNARKEIFDDRHHLELSIVRLKELCESEADFQTACRTLCERDPTNAQYYRDCCERYGLIYHWFSPVNTRELPLRTKMWEEDRKRCATEKINKEKIWSKLDSQMLQMINTFYGEVLKRAESLDFGLLALSKVALINSRGRYAEAVKAAFFDSIATNKMHRFLFLLNEESNGIDIGKLKIEHGTENLNPFEYAAVRGSEQIVQFILMNRPLLAEQTTISNDSLLNMIEESIGKSQEDSQLMARLEACKKMVRAKGKGSDTPRRESTLRRMLSGSSKLSDVTHEGTSAANGSLMIADAGAAPESPRKPKRAPPVIAKVVDK